MNARRGYVAAFFVLTLLLLGGCQTLERAMGEYDPRLRPEQQAYEEALAPYLVKGTMHTGPATELMVTALPLTATVRQAMAKRQAQAQGLPLEQAQALAANARQEAGEGLEVIQALYAPERERGDLAARNPSWRLWLKQGDAQMGPGDLRQVRDRSSLHEAIYPFWGPWEFLWRVRFPARAAGETLLVISGAPGRLDLKLKLD
jgi:hypothetical protein